MSDERDWLAAWSAMAPGPGQRGHTVLELSQMFNANERTVRVRLRELANAGRLRCFRELRTDITGTARRLPVYQLIQDQTPPASRKQTASRTATKK